MAANPYQAVIDAINAILDDTSLEATVEAVINRLVSFGYTPVTGDAWAIAFSVRKAQNSILSQTAQATVPDGLFHVLVDMIAAGFLIAMYSTGQLELSDLDMDGMISSVHEGDTTVNFSAEGSDEAKIQSLLQWLTQGKGSELLCYRKMRW